MKKLIIALVLIVVLPAYTQERDSALKRLDSIKLKAVVAHTDSLLLEQTAARYRRKTIIDLGILKIRVRRWKKVDSLKREIDTLNIKTQ